MNLNISCPVLKYFWKVVFEISSKRNKWSFFIFGLLRTEKAAIPSNHDEDLLITGQFHKTLEELDEDLEGNLLF
jgi:hypothetical protein